MTQQTAGIHHITAFVSSAQATVTFYAGVLAQRLVKKQSTSMLRKCIICISETKPAAQARS